MMNAKLGEWVQIHKTILKPEDRSPNLPEDTKREPLEMWQKGFLTQNAHIGEIVEIETIIGRRVKGKLVKINPPYSHNFGKPIPELLSIGKELRDILEGEDK
nr:2-amino-4-oxopentanoate thiolase subunit OrtA [Tepidanaerobacter syntrophicus]